jgi:hypothetical protein
LIFKFEKETAVLGRLRYRFLAGMHPRSRGVEGLQRNAQSKKVSLDMRKEG